MGRRRNGEPPAYKLHRASGLAYATLNGKRHYFGVHGSAESRRKYAEFIKDWERSHGIEIRARATSKSAIAEIVPAYVAQLRPTLSDTEKADIARNLETLADRWGQYRPDSFRGSEFKALRRLWLAAGHFRPTIKKASGRVRRFFRWMVAEELCRPETHAIICAVEDLRPGEAPEGRVVFPVPLRTFVRTLWYAPRQLRAIALVQYYAGPRPSEACRMTGAEIYRAGEMFEVDGRSIRVPAGVWLFYPEFQKTKKKAVYVIGPRLQRVLVPFLREDPAEPMFQPRESRADWIAKKRAARKSKVQPSQVDRSKANPKMTAGTVYGVASYWKRIQKAAERAGADPWHPHQLRHNFVGRMDAAAGLALASEGVGHGSMATTLIYLERKLKDVATVARKIG